MREGSYVVLLAGAGITHTDATLLSLLTGVSLAAASLVGAAALLAPRSASAIAAASPREVVRQPQR